MAAKSKKKSHKVKKRKRRLRKAKPVTPYRWVCPICGRWNGPPVRVCSCGQKRGNIGKPQKYKGKKK